MVGLGAVRYGEVRCGKVYFNIAEGFGKGFRKGFMKGFMKGFKKRYVCSSQV